MRDTTYDPIEKEWLLHPETGLPLDRHFEVDGWVYATMTDKSDGDIQIWHYLICDECVKNIEWRTREPMKADQVRLWLALGGPDRQGLRPLNQADLNHLATERLLRTAA